MTDAALRIGVVPYLNMLPFAHGLDALSLDGSALEIHGLPPAEMTRRMEACEIDVGMIPVGGLFDHPEWSVVGSTAITSHRDVLSVLICSLDPVERWALLHPDAQSRTSNALSQILLRRQYGLDVGLGSAIPVQGWTPPDDPHAGEAFVLIGTRALIWRQWWRDRGGVTLDLGRAWTTWTERPFVYAVWAAREGVDCRRWIDRIESYQRENMERLDEIVTTWPGLTQEHLSPEDAVAYLTRHIQFDLGEGELAGLQRYYEEGRALGIFPEGWALRRL